MSSGIIGSGALGSNVARMFGKRGIAATITNRRGPASLAPLIAEVGSSIKAGTIEEAASAEIVLGALRWVALARGFWRLPSWSGRTRIHPTHPAAFPHP